MSTRRNKPQAQPDLAEVLLQLDRQMDDAHLSPDHPWRLLIAETMAAREDKVLQVRQASAPEATEGAPFFDLAASYLIAPGATLDDLLNDFHCLYDSGLGALECDGDSFSSGVWAGVYMLRQAGAVAEEVAHRVRAAERARGGAA